MQPPLLPSAVLARVLRIAKFEGWGVLLLSGTFALFAALSGEKAGAIFGTLIAGAGALEVHGRQELLRGAIGGMRWLVGSQVFLVTVIGCYCVWQVQHFDLAAVHAALVNQPDDTPSQIYARGLLRETVQNLELSGLSVDDVLRTSNRQFYTALAVISLVYQGGMAVYYARKTPAVRRALDERLPDPARSAS